MRIRRRPPLPPISSPLPPPPPPQIPDPPLFQLQPPSKGEETKEKGVREGGGEGLHPVGDLPIEPHGWVMDPINWDPSSSASHPTTGRSKQGSKPPFFPPTLSHAKVLKEVKEEEEMVDSNKRWKTQVNSNKRIGSSSSAVVSEAAVPGERPLLPKKRRGGGDDNGNEYGRREEKTPKSKARAKGGSRAENDCTTVNGGENKRADAAMVNGSIGSNGKKRRSPAVLVEGSRCSRVNGRGWRCCQQTLVGYSLCEHHLGKGRLRSMSGVRVQACSSSSSNKPKKSTEGGADGAAPLSSSPREDEKVALDVKQCSGVDHGEMDMEEEKQLRKRRKKIGMVKARTISSLLDETNHSVQSTLSAQSSPPPPKPLESAPMQPTDEGATIV